VGSSSEANSPVSPAATENLQEKLEEFDETRGEPDVEVTVDKSHDSSRDFASRSSGVSRSIHQLCVIITVLARKTAVQHQDNHRTFVTMNRCFPSKATKIPSLSWRRDDRFSAQNGKD
jgi:hypothetical protein